MDTIYAYWDAAQIKYVLDSVAILTSMSDYTGLMKVFAIFGLFVAVATTFVKARGEDAAIYMLMLAIWYVGLFLPKKDVVIQDVATGTGTYTVANVPLGLAVFASAESHIGYWLTRVSETVFALPNDINFQKTGFMFGARAIKDRQSVRFYDPNLVSSLTNLTKDCVYPELNNNAAFFNQIMQSGNIWADLGPQMNPGVLVQVYDSSAGTYKVVGCDQAWSYIDSQINPHVSNDIMPRLGRMLNPTVTSAAAASTLVAAQLPLVDNMIFGVSQSAQDSIKQAAMINLISDSTVFVPQMIGDTTSAQVALSTAIATQSANSSYLTMAKIAESSMPLIRNAIHIVILALFPIVMLLIIVAGSKGGLVLKTYLMALLWINLWAPIYAALNFFTSWYATHGALAAVGSMNYLSYASHQALTHSMISDQGVAGILTLSVPVIAYMLTNVSAASFTSVISGVMSPANASAQSAGSQVGLGNSNVGNTQWGNVTMGNWSWNNRSQDQWNTAPSMTGGAATMKEVLQGGSAITNIGGAPGVLNRQGAVSNLGDVGLNLDTGVSTVAREQSQRMAQSASHFASSSASSLQAGLQNIRDFASRVSSGDRTGRGYGSDVTSSVVNAASRMEQAAQDLAAKTGLTDKQAFQLMASASARLGIGGYLAAELKAQGKSESEITSAYETAQKLVNSDSYKEDKQAVYGYAHRVNTEAFAGNERSAVNGIKASLTQAQTAEATAGKEMRLAESYSTVAERAASGQWGAGLNPANEYVHNWRRGPEDADAYLRSASPENKLADVQQFVGVLAERMAQAGIASFRDGSGRNAGLQDEATKAAGPPPVTAREVDELDVQNRADVRQQHREDRQSVPGNPGRGNVPDAGDVRQAAQAGIRRTISGVEDGRESVNEAGQPLTDKTNANLEGAQKPFGVAGRAVANVNPLSDFDGFENNPANPKNRDQDKGEDDGPGRGASGSW